jgi:hypothetical protein
MAQPFWDINFSVADPGPYYAPGETDENGDGENGHNFYPDNPFDTMTLAGERVPGVVTVNPVRKRYIWTYQAPGAAPHLNPAGFEVMRFQVQTKIWTPRMWLSLQRLVRVLMPLKIGTIGDGITDKQAAANDTKALDVVHPSLALLGVKSVICTSLGPLSGEQVKTFTFELMEYTKVSSPPRQINASRSVVPAFNKNQLTNGQVVAQSGRVPRINSTQGPQPAPSSAPTLTVTP